MLEVIPGAEMQLTLSVSEKSTFDRKQTGPFSKEILFVVKIARVERGIKALAEA